MQKRALVTPRNGARVLNAEGSADLEGLNFFNVHWRQVSFYIILPLVSVDIRFVIVHQSFYFPAVIFKMKFAPRFVRFCSNPNFGYPNYRGYQNPSELTKNYRQLGNWRTWKVLMTNFRIGTSCLSKGLLFRWFYTFYSSRCCSLCSE